MSKNYLVVAKSSKIGTTDSLQENGQILPLKTFFETTKNYNFENEENAITFAKKALEQDNEFYKATVYEGFTEHGETIKRFNRNAK